ncbi:MAG TPA: hypothetical protein VHW23_14890 [Kofleriaceae bacterium]|jgi:hypothetical protein|nr:hypothetical protein [Kofleriaceae bacterium]
MRAAILALLLAALGAGRARAQPALDAAIAGDARAHWERGLAEHAAHRYQAASADFAACYRLEPRRECLFAWAQAARLSGDCETASELYRRYLQAELSPRQAEAARSQLAACEAQLAARPAADHAAPATAPAAEPPPPANVAPARPAAPPQSPPPAPWYHDAWGDALAGAGVVSLVTGAVLYAAARHNASSSAPTYDAYADQLARAGRTRDWAVVALGAGTALLAGGIARMVLTTRIPRVELAVARTQLTFRWAAAF